MRPLMAMKLGQMTGRNGGERWLTKRADDPKLFRVGRTENNGDWLSETNRFSDKMAGEIKIR